MSQNVELAYKRAHTAYSNIVDPRMQEYEYQRKAGFGFKNHTDLATPD